MIKQKKSYNIKFIILILIIALSALIISIIALVNNTKSTYIQSLPPVIHELKYMIANYPIIKDRIQYLLKNQPKYNNDKSSNSWYNQSVEYFVEFFNKWLIFKFWSIDPPFFSKSHPASAGWYNIQWENLYNYTYATNNFGGDTYYISGAFILMDVQAHGDQTQQYTKNIFASWINKFYTERGKFVKTPASAKYIKKIIGIKPYNQVKQKQWNVKNIVIPKNGFKTWHQLFLRTFKKDKNGNFPARPIAAPNNQCIAISPAEGSIMWLYKELTVNTPLTVKFDVMNIRQIMNNIDKYANKFIGGYALDILLWFTNYHWFHAPVTGTIVDIFSSPGSTNYNFSRQNWWQSSSKHNRTVIIYNTKYFGYVAMIPVGFGSIAGVNITVKKGDYIHKGTPVGHFEYGASSIILLFEKDKTQICTNIINSEKMLPNSNTPDPPSQLGMANPILVNEIIAYATVPNCPLAKKNCKKFAPGYSCLQGKCVPDYNINTSIDQCKSHCFDTSSVTHSVTHKIFE